MILRDIWTGTARFTPAEQVVTGLRPRAITRAKWTTTSRHILVESRESRVELE